MLTIGSEVIRVDNIELESRFWCNALDLQERDQESDGYRLVIPKSGKGTRVALDKVPAPKVLPPVIHLDLYTNEQEVQVERLITLGAKRIHWVNNQLTQIT